MADTGTELTVINELSDLVITKEVVESEDFSKKYEMFSAFLAKMNEMDATIKAGIKIIAEDNYMSTGDSTITSTGYKFTYIPETTRESLNTKALKADHPDIYKEYVKVGSVSPSLRVTKVEKKDA